MLKINYTYLFLIYTNVILFPKISLIDWNKR